MRILLINNSFAIKGGADRVFINTGKLLEQMQHDVFYFSTFNDPAEESAYSKYFVQSRNFRELDFFSKVSEIRNYIYHKQAYRNLTKLIRDFRPEVAHIHLFCGGLSLSVLKALHDNNIPVVQTVHDYRHLCPANALLDNHNKVCEKCKNKSYYQCGIKRCVDGNIFYSSIVSIEAYFRKYLINPLDLIDHFIFVSNFSRDKHIEFNPRYREKSSKIYNFTFIPETAPKTSKGSYFLYFGRLSKEKGLHTLINAAKEAGYKLKIIGGGPIQKEIELAAKDCTDIELIGHLKGQALTEMLSNASYIMVPSEWYENNPMTVLEAYALGKPVIGANIGGIPEIVIDGETGFLFTSRDKDDLKKVMKKASELSDEQYENLSANSYHFVNTHFSTTIHYDQLLKVYNNLIR